MLMGLGVPDVRGVFNTTLGLDKMFGSDRAMDIPCSESAMTGVCLGMALNGHRPVLSHQRLDFALLAMDQMVTQASNWHYMFGGAMHMPVVFRMVIGRGWGQGPQHSQSLHAWFAHVPGLKVVMPATPNDAKGLMTAAIRDNNPVVYLDHRWLHYIEGQVDESDDFVVPIGQARVAETGSDVTLISLSYATIEALHAAKALKQYDVHTEVIDLRSIHPWDQATVLASVSKTRRAVIVDTANASFGISAEIAATITQHLWGQLEHPPVRIANAPCPTPTSPALSSEYYPRAPHIVRAVLELIGLDASAVNIEPPTDVELDKPDPSFTGPF